MDRTALRRDFERVRALSVRLATPLRPPEWRVQSMPDVSPPYWNLGHTSWFFARNVLAELDRPVNGFPGFDYAFNSYYEGLGPRLPRDQRGSVEHPSTEATLEYRRAVDAGMLRAIAECDERQWPAFEQTVRIGLQHEQQHQELMVTEIQHIRWTSGTGERPAYAQRPAAKNGDAGAPPTDRPAHRRNGSAPRLQPVGVGGGVVEIGHREGGFCWDNELPVHRAVVGDGAFGDRLITNREWLAFIEDGGYRNPLLWLSNGWAKVTGQGWQAPLYWEHGDGAWRRFTLRGAVPLDPDAPVCHVSFYEAEAFARWFGQQFPDWRDARIPTEREWEHAARSHGFDPNSGNLLEDDPEQSAFDVRPADPRSGLRQLAGDVWEWTSSHYEPYPGYRPFAGALMEYNGKFMDNQRVLRGGSFATPRPHARVAYRNFWPPDTRFQVTGVRLMRDA